jgi:hypothetical protein
MLIGVLQICHIYENFHPARCLIYITLKIFHNVVLNVNFIEPKKRNYKGDKKMPTVVEIGQAGERFAVQALKNERWTIDVWNTQAPGSTDIEAHSGPSKILVQVKSAIFPNEPTSLSSDEERNIKSRATRIGAKAYEARVHLNSNLTLKNEIQWKVLN